MQDEKKSKEQLLKEVAELRRRVELAERKQRELAEVMGEVGTVLSGTLDFELVLDRLLDQVARIVPFDAANVTLIEQGRSRIARMRGYDQFEPQIAAASFEVNLTPNLSWMVETGQALVIPDKASYDGWVDAGAASFLRSWVGAPIRSHGQVIGLFSLDKAEPGFYHPEHARRLTALADQAALALENARLFEAEARRRREAEVLREAAAALTQALELDQVLEEVLIYLERVVPYDSSCIFLLEGEDKLRAVAGRGFPQPEAVVGQSFPVKGSDLFRRVQQASRPIVLADARLEPDFGHWGGVDYIRGWMGVPLIVRGEVIGYITVDNRQTAAYSETEATQAQALAHHAATAIYNGRLYDQARRSEERYYLRFEDSPISLWEEDFSAVKRYIERLQAEEGITDLRSYFKDHPEVVVECVSLVELTDVNKATLKFFQAESKEELLKNLDQFFGPESLPIFAEGLAILLEGATAFDQETINYTLQGEKKYVTVKWSVVSDYEETLSKVLISLVDITARKQAEANLREYQDHLEELVESRTTELQKANTLLKQEISERARAEEALRLIQFAVEQAADAIFWVGVEAQFLYVNEAACRLLEYSREELLTMSFHQIDPHFPAEVWPSHWRTTQQRGALTVESRYRTKRGQLLPVEVTFNYLQYGGQAYNFVFARDISWRHWAVEAIRDSEQRLADIINFLPDPTFVIDEESKVIAWNRAMEELTGVKAEAILGKGDYEYALPFYGKRRPILIDLALQPDAEMERQYKFIERDRDNLIGEVHLPSLEQRQSADAWIKARPLYDVQGNLTGAIETIRDITERKRAAEALAETNHQLQALNDRLQGELTLAHKIQQGLLLPARPHANLVCYSSPAREVGGDFYMYHVFEPPTQAGEIGTMAVAVGDVSGKGMPAALLMAVSLTALQSVVAQAIDPAALLVQLDRVIAPYTQATRQNCALCYMVVASQADGTTQVRVANAGCVAPLIRRAGGKVEWVEVGGLPLGVGLGAQLGYPEATLNLRPGELVLLTSDGLVEATDEAGNLFSFERLAQAVAQGPQTDAAAMLAHLQAEVAAFTGQTEPHDDLTIVVLQV